MALRGAIVTSAIALLLGCAPAYATESSVDAYAGEAAVLGKPTHRIRHGGAGNNGISTGARETNTHSTGTNTGTGSSSGTGPTSGGSSASGTSGTGASGGAGSNTPTSPTGGGGSGGTAGGGKAPSGAAGGVPSIYPAASAGGNSISALDIALIAAGALGLACIALLLRRVARTAS